MPAEPSPVSLSRDSMEGAFGEYHGCLETESDRANLRQTTQHAIPWPGKHRTSGLTSSPRLKPGDSNLLDGLEQ
jgi:hypothetical protein